MKIRAATEADRDVIWKIFHEIVATGDTYAFDPKMSREQALAYSFRADAHTYVAELDRQSVGGAVGFPGAATPSPGGGTQARVIAGAYMWPPNQADGGSHVS